MNCVKRISIIFYAFCMILSVDGTTDIFSLSENTWSVQNENNSK